MRNLFIALFALCFVANLALGAGLYFSLQKSSHLEDQQANQLSSIQQMNLALGLTKSELATQKDLAKKYQAEVEAFPEELRKIIKKHKLDLHSRDATIAKLTTQLKGGTTVVIEVPPDSPDGPKKISYDWKDPGGRFHLNDPDIFVPNNETFEASQLLQLKGWVFSDDSGKLQIKKVEVVEVRRAGSKDGKPVYEKIANSSAQLVDSQFEYTDPSPKQVGVWDVIRPKLYASLDSSADAGVGVEVLNFGKLLPFANVGLGAEINPDLTNVFEGSLANTRLGANLTYRLLEPLIDSNLGLAVGISTPANDLGGRWELSADAIFYLTN